MRFQERRGYLKSAQLQHQRVNVKGQGLPNGEFDFDENSIRAECLDVIRPQPVLLISAGDFADLEHSVLVAGVVVAGDFVPLK